MTVAVLDTGVQADLPELNGVVLPGKDIAGGGNGDARVDRDEAPIPGHGTGMAALIAAQGGPSGYVGVAPEAKILPVDIHGSSASTAPGIRYAVDRGAEVINMSVTAPGPCPDDTEQAVAYAIEHDVVIVAGAGNTGNTDNISNFPANCAGVLAVGAIDNQLRAWPKTQRQPYVTVAAPGVETGGLVKSGKFYRFNGTSDASALTSAAVALVRSKYPDMSAREVVQRVIASARDVGPPGKDDQTGYGVVRPLHALQDEVPKNAPNPVFDAYDQWVAANGKQADEGTLAKAKERDDKGFAPSPFSIVLIASAGLTVLVLIVILIAKVFRKPRQQAPVGAVWGPNSGPVPQQPGPPEFGPPPFGQPPMGTAGHAPAGWPQAPAAPQGPGAPNPSPPPSTYGPPDQGRP